MRHKYYLKMFEITGLLLPDLYILELVLRGVLHVRYIQLNSYFLFISWFI